MHFKEERNQLIQKMNAISCNDIKQIEDFYEEVRDVRKNIVDQREGLEEMDPIGIALDEFLLEVEEIIFTLESSINTHTNKQ